MTALGFHKKMVAHYVDKRTLDLPELNLIKITCLICSRLLMCCGVGKQGNTVVAGADPGGEQPAPPKIEKIMIFLRKIVIFHTKYPQQFFRLAIIFNAPPILNSWIRPCVGLSFP